jgi:hypothetical protein
MKDEHDKCTAELLHIAQPVAGGIPPRPAWLKPVLPLSAIPEGAKPGLVSGGVGYFVPVSFVAKDWSVTARRIRVLLTAGRLEGRLQDNGYWEVRFPYQFTMGTRGPGLKKQQRPSDRPRKSGTDGGTNRKTTLQEVGK